MKEIITYSPELQYLIKLWQRAADPDDATAQFSLAKFYFYIEQKSPSKSGFTKNAFGILKKLANQRYTQVQTDAQFMLAKCYENGFGVTKNYQRAVRWYEKAEENISIDLMKNPDPVGDSVCRALEKAVGGKDIEDALDEIIFEKLTPELLNCITESAENGDVDAQVYLMNLYHFRVNSEENTEKCVFWAKQAAENDNAEAMEVLGNMYYYGSGVTQDYKSALYWLEKAAARGAEYACFLLGKYYKSQKQYKISAKWYRNYAKQRITWRNKRLGWEKR